MIEIITKIIRYLLRGLNLTMIRKKLLIIATACLMLVNLRNISAQTVGVNDPGLAMDKKERRVDIEAIPIASFKVGMENDEIPNYEEIGGGYISPRNLLIDNENNIYIFIGGTKRVIKIANNNRKTLENIELADYPYFFSIFFERHSEKFFALSASEVFVMDKKFKFIGTIDFTDIMVSQKTSFDNIEVYNDNIFLYLGDSSDLYSFRFSKYINKKPKFLKTQELILNNNLVNKIFKNKNIKEDKFSLTTGQGIIKEINISTGISFLVFIYCLDHHLYLLGANPLSDTYNEAYRVIIVDKDYHPTLLKLKSSEAIYATSRPILFSIDKNGNIYQLCSEKNRINLYFYKMF